MSKPIRVLLIEDNEDDALLIVRELRDGGFDPTYTRVESLEALKVELAGHEWDCIISDYSMPHFGGLAALAEVQSAGKDIPFILVSGTIGEDLAVAAMKWGAHDYIMKDKLSRLVPAIQRELKEAEAHREQVRTNAALKEIEQRFRKSFEYAPIGMALVALDGQWLQVNPALCHIVGYTKEELLGITFQTMTHHDELEADLRQVDRLVTGEIQSYHMEKRYRHKLGHYIWVQLAVSLVRDPHDRPSYFIAQIQDIAERKDSMRQIRFLAEAVNSTRDCIFLTDIEGRILFVNPAVPETYGYSLDELTGKDISLLLSTTNPRGLEARIREKTLSGGWKGDLIHCRSDGSEFPVELWTSLIRDESGSPAALIGVARDISARVAAEKHLRESEEEFRLISENVADMIVVLTPDGKRVYNNPSYTTILGDPAVLQGTESFQEIHPDDRERVRQIFLETVRTGVGQRTEYRFLLKDGSVRDIESQGSVIRGDDGKVLRVVVVSRDVTEQKKLEQQFLRAQRMESIGTLASGIAHDLNNVLAPIMMAIEIIRGKLTDPNGKKLLDTIEKSAQRGSDIVKQVLAFGRGVTGEQISLQLKHVIKEVTKIADETFPKSIEIRSNIPKDLWTVSADPTQMHQVLLNICVNARDAMPGGGSITIAAENVTLDENYSRMHIEAKPGPYVVMSIADTGTGIPENIRERIFEPFFTTKEVGKGTGLGLSTVLAIMRSHNGFVDVYSEPGKGTTFRIYIPASTSGAAAPAETTKADLLMGRGELILVIDDEAAIREITRETLETYGYAVILGRDGAEGIAVFAEHRKRIKVVITDLMMPVMDGTAVIHALQHMDPEVKIIAASGMAADGRLPSFSNRTVRASLVKPYTAEKLLLSLAQVLGRG
jgi:PAS domain S-box-containing protein